MKKTVESIEAEARKKMVQLKRPTMGKMWAIVYWEYEQKIKHGFISSPSQFVIPREELFMLRTAQQHHSE